jgi:hypothetical protein
MPAPPRLLANQTVATLLLLILGGAVAAGETVSSDLVLAGCDALVRPGLPFRFRLQRAVTAEDFGRGPYLLQMSLEHAGQTLALGEEPLAKLGQLRDGLQAVLLPGALDVAQADQPVRLRVVLANPVRGEIQRLDHEFTTPLRIQREWQRNYQQWLASGSHDPLPALWFEQGGELMRAGASLGNCAALVELQARLATWMAGTKTPLLAGGSYLLAYRDPVDGSVQPFRLHLPSAPGHVPVALVLGRLAVAPRKSAWPDPPAGWLTGARAAGMAVVEAYPAGDIAWNGIAPARALRALVAAAEAWPALDAKRVALIGVGPGAAGAIRLAEDHPGRFSALALVDPILPPEPAVGDRLARDWLGRSRTGMRPSHLVGLSVTISGESEAGVDDWRNRLERAGGMVTAGFATPATDAFWKALGGALAATTQPFGEYVVLAPGRYGQATVEQLTRWGEPATLRFEPGPPPRLATSGIVRLRLDDPTILVNGRPYAAPTGVLPAPGKVLGQATGPLAAYADDLFVVVVGTREHAAALEDNRRLAQAFVSAWAAHAQGLPPVVDDTAFDERAFPRHHLVLIGNARSNQILQDLTAKGLILPIVWDSRSLTCAGATWLRNQRRAVALAWPHPAHDGRLLVILDGVFAWRGGLPLAGLPDLVIGGEQPDDPPAVFRLFDGEWR